MSSELAAEALAAEALAAEALAAEALAAEARASQAAALTAEAPAAPMEAAEIAEAPSSCFARADACLCHVARATTAALELVSARAESARTQLASVRARLLDAVNARVDTLEARVADAEASARAAFDLELCAADVALERLRASERGAAVALSALSVLTAQGVDAADVEALLLALTQFPADEPCAAVDDLRVDLRAETSLLAARIAGLGGMPKGRRSIHGSIHGLGLDSHVPLEEPALRAAAARALCQEVARAFDAARAEHADHIDHVEHVDHVVGQGQTGLGLVAAVVGVLRAHADSAGVAALCCRALIRAAAQGDARKAADDAGAFRVVVAAVRAHQEDAEIVGLGCAALKSIAAGTLEELRGAANVLANALCVHSDNATLVEHGCAVLVHFATENEDAKAVVVAAIVDLLRARPCHRFVAELGTLALLGVVMVNRVSFALDVGATSSALVAVLRANVDNLRVVEPGCAFFAMLTPCVSNSAVSLALADVLRAHTHNRSVALTTCAFFARLTGPCAALAAVAAVSAALGIHVADPEIAHWACQALHNLRIYGGAPIQYAAAARDIVSVLRAHVCLPDVVASACLAISRVAEVGVGGVGRRAALDAGAAAALVAARAAHATNAVLVQRVSETLVRLV